MDFWGRFSLGKTGGKNPPQNPRQNSNKNLGASRPKSTLQESALEIFHLRQEIAIAIAEKWRHLVHSPALPFIFFVGGGGGGIPCCFFPREELIPFFLSVLPFFSRDFRGSVRKKALFFGRVFLAFP